MGLGLRGLGPGLDNKKSSLDVDLVQTTAYKGKGYSGSIENIDYERKSLNLNEELLSYNSNDIIGDYDYVSSSYNPPAPQARGGLKENIQFFSYRLAKPSKPIFFPKVEKSEAN